MSQILILIFTIISYNIGTLNAHIGIIVTCFHTILQTIMLVNEFVM